MPSADTTPLTVTANEHRRPSLKRVRLVYFTVNVRRWYFHPSTSSVEFISFWFVASHLIFQSRASPFPDFLQLQVWHDDVGGSDRNVQTRALRTLVFLCLLICRVFYSRRYHEGDITATYNSEEPSFSVRASSLIPQIHALPRVMSPNCSYDSFAIPFLPSLFYDTSRATRHVFIAKCVHKSFPSTGFVGTERHACGIVSAILATSHARTKTCSRSVQLSSPNHPPCVLSSVKSLTFCVLLVLYPRSSS
ncbi:hypothetical protein B0H19DRAFT_376521 [Mycena capillaripes]|nr:hypothetical protein B0H19DRAFT_376521 [Mycena capillaripes]